MSLVSFIQVGSSGIKKSIEHSLDLINFGFQKDAKKVIIKPNMCYYWDYSTGQTTDPKFVTSLIEIIREKISSNLDISIVESDASAMKCRYAFKFLGYECIARTHNVNLVNLSEDKSEKVEVKAGSCTFHLMLPETIKNADIKINIPKMKYLNLTKVSCALKNVFGCNPEPNKFKYHSKIDEAIVALNKIMRFNVSILDGIIVSGSRPIKLGLTMASKDPVAIDAAVVKMMGINPKSITHIKLASKEGLGNISFISKGENTEFFKNRFPQFGLRHKILSSGYKLVTWAGLLDPEML